MHYLGIVIVQMDTKEGLGLYIPSRAPEEIGIFQKTKPRADSW